MAEKKTFDAYDTLGCLGERARISLDSHKNGMWRLNQDSELYGGIQPKEWCYGTPQARLPAITDLIRTEVNEKGPVCFTFHFRLSLGEHPNVKHLDSGFN